MKKNELLHQEVYEKKLKNNKEYMSLQEKHSSVWDKLKEQLPEDQLKLLLELDNINNELQTIEQTTFYESGLQERIK
jgi:hypothetical protein